jgi:lipopolysaccharide export system protein LptC
MSAEQSSRRFRIAVVLALMLALALASFWLREVIRRAASDFIPEVQRTEPDFYVENFNYVKLSATGKAQYHFSGTRLTHNPQDDSYDIQHPFVRSVGKAQAPMTMHSERAHVNSDSSEVRMYEDVHMDRPAIAEAAPLHVKSEYMLLLPDDDVVKTDKAVEIISGTTTLTGIGMYANNASREFRLASNVHGTYQAPSR